MICMNSVAMFQKNRKARGQAQTIHRCALSRPWRGSAEPEDPPRHRVEQLAAVGPQEIHRKPENRSQVPAVFKLGSLKVDLY